MKPITIHIVQALLLYIFLCCSACSKAPSPISARSCTEFNQVIALAMNEDMLELYPEEFIEKYKHLIVVQSDKTTDKFAPTLVRDIDFKAAKGDWLISASGFYDSSVSGDPQRLRLIAGSFSINPSCIPGEQLAARMSQQVPLSRQSSSDRINDSWAWDHLDPKDDVRRFITFSNDDGHIHLSTGLRPNVDLSELQDQEESGELDEAEIEQDAAGETDVQEVDTGEQETEE